MEPKRLFENKMESVLNNSVGDINNSDPIPIASDINNSDEKKELAIDNFNEGVVVLLHDADTNDVYADDTNDGDADAVDLDVEVPGVIVANNEEHINIMKIFKKFKCSRIILSYLRLSHIVSLSFLSKALYKMVNKYYCDCINLDLSEYYGVIGSPEFDHQSFMNDFLPKFKAVQSLSLRYCSHLKVVHLDNIIKALTHENVKNAEQKVNASDDNIKNEEIKSLNLYFCSRLGSRALWKISSRLINLEYLNLARCYAITADKNINGLKLLGSLPLKTLAISLHPSIQSNEAIDVYSLLIDDDSFRSLKTLDLSHGCEVLHEMEDLSDLTLLKKIHIIKPAQHNK